MRQPRRGGGMDVCVCRFVFSDVSVSFVASMEAQSDMEQAWLNV